MRHHVLLPAICSALLLMSGTVHAQSKLGLPEYLGLQQETKAGSRAQLDGRSVPMDAPLDAAEYTVGPGDLLGIHIWSTSPVELQLSVTPEAFVHIPNVGTVQVRDLTLDSVRSTVLPLVSRKYPGAQVAISLLAPRKVSVQISGQVMNEGMQEMSSVQRVDHLIAQANSLPTTQTTREFYEQEIPRFRRNASERNISIRRRDGSVHRVDLVKFRITGSSRYNPYLCEGDLVFVPRRRPSDNNIGVLGGVLGPTNVEFAEGDLLTDLVQVGFGLKPGADPSRALLARESPAGGMDTLRVDLQAILEGRAPDVPLLPGDRLLIPERPETRVGEFVTVEGAVQRPGRYAITASRTTLRELLREAGGFTSDANPVGSTLMRFPQEDLFQAQMRGRFSGGAEDSSYFLSETDLRRQGEMVSVDFRRLVLKGDSTADVTLRNRDLLVVPVAQRNVYVFGQVGLPGYVPFAPGQHLGYYIDQAKGYTDLARSGDVKVIKAGSRAWLDPGDTEIEDGDMIWVPRDNPETFSETLTTVAQIAAVIGTVATIIILAQTL